MREGSKTLYFGLKGCKNYAYRIRHKLLLRANALACMFSVAFTEGPHLCTSRETLYCVQLGAKKYKRALHLAAHRQNPNKRILCMRVTHSLRIAMVGGLL